MKYGLEFDLAGGRVTKYEGYDTWCGKEEPGAAAPIPDEDGIKELLKPLIGRQICFERERNGRTIRINNGTLSLNGADVVVLVTEEGYPDFYPVTEIIEKGLGEYPGQKTVTSEHERRWPYAKADWIKVSIYE
ncbi:MAG: hypothetical protein ABIH90_02885 [Candidatus Aenigmatarchaeota archaeon]